MRKDGKMKVTPTRVAPRKPARAPDSPSSSCGRAGVTPRAYAALDVTHRIAVTPEVWLLADHVVVQGDNVDTDLAQCPQHGLHLGGGHDEIAIHRREFV